MNIQSAVQIDEAQGLTVKVIERRNAPGEWGVEAINMAGDGEVYITIFSGPSAKARAAEYAEIKYGVAA